MSAVTSHAQAVVVPVLQTSVPVRDANGDLLPGVTEYLIYHKIGFANKKIPHKFGTHERYYTHGWTETPEHSYSVGIDERAGPGTVSRTQQVSANNHLSGSLRANLGALDGGVAAGANRESGSQLNETRDANIEDITFKIKGGAGGGCFGGVPTRISLYLYTIDPSRVPAAAAAGSTTGSSLASSTTGPSTLPPPGAATAQPPAAPSALGIKEDVAIQTCNEPDTGSLPPEAFGAEKWQEYFGVRVETVPLPPHMRELCESQRGKVMAVFIPSQITRIGSERAERFDFAKFQELLALAERKGEAAICSPTNCLPLKEWGRGQWVVMTKEIVEGTLSKDFATQEEVLKRQSPLYQVPTPFEVFVCALLYKVQSGVSLFEKNVKGTALWTRCQKEPGLEWEPVVGGFNEKGIRVVSLENMTKRADNIGMAAIVR